MPSPLARNAALLALALAAAPVLAAPLPPPRPMPESLQPLRTAGTSRAAPAERSSSACATRLEAVLEQLERRAEAAHFTPLPTPHTVDAGDIAVLEDDGTFFYPNGGGAAVMDIAAVTRAFYRTHDDSATMLAIYLASGSSQWLGSPTALAAAWTVRNQISGLGLGAFDFGDAFGSPSRLELVLTMNGLHRYLDDPEEEFPNDTFDALGILAHEFGHRWLSYTFVDSAGTTSPALLGRDWQHWNFFADVDSSFMEGCDWTVAGPDTFVSTGATTAFGALDQYLMGLRSKAETGPILVVNDPTDLDPPGVYVPYSIPAVGVGCDGRATVWTVDDIERVHGPRVPDASSAPHSWRVAFVLVVPRGQDATPADLAKLGAIQSLFPQRIANATGGRGAVDVTLSSRPGRLVGGAEPLPDTEDTAAPRAFGVRVTREDGAMPLAVDAGSVRLHWRAGTSGPFAEVPLSPAGPDSFAAQLPSGSGTVEYWVSAASVPAGLLAEWPEGGEASPASYFAGPDLQPPVVQHFPFPEQGVTRFPQVLLARVRDNTALDAVWCEYSVDGGPLTSVPATAAGHDSFTVSLGGGIGLGKRLAWRFVARDAAAAANIGVSNPAFDTLRVVRGLRDDFENPSGYLHLPSLWSYRDAWAIDTFRSSPPGGASWHFGASDGLPYPPHSDAVLYLPWCYDVVPGVTLRFDEWHDLEQQDATRAWDAFRIEAQAWGSSTTQPVEPVPGYTHTMLGRSLSIPRNAECWSGTSDGWVTRTLDLSGYAPGPVRVVFRACADEFLGAGGVWIDRMRVLYPGDATLSVPPSPGEVACGRAWPNPTRGDLRLPLSLARGAQVDWALHDVQGRRVATLWRGAAEPSVHELVANAPGSLSPGLYFARVRVDGREAAPAQRIAIVR